jgi:hypothetical protein
MLNRPDVRIPSFDKERMGAKGIPRLRLRNDNALKSAGDDTGYRSFRVQLYGFL